MDITRKDVSGYIASKVKAGRGLRSLTQVQLSRATGISQNFISNIENGASSIDAYDLMAIAVALDLPYGWFLPVVEGWLAPKIETPREILAEWTQLDGWKYQVSRKPE